MLGRREPPDRHERTPEERARAAAERAARRGGQPLPPPEPAPASPPETPSGARPEPPPVARPEPRPVARQEPTTRPLPPRKPPRRARRAEPRPLPPKARGSGRAGRRILALLAFLAVGVAVWFIYATFQPFHGEGRGAVAVKIPAGADAGAIGSLLAERGVVDSGTLFSLNATITGRRGDLKSGDYTLPQNMSYGDALDALIAGPKAKVIPTFQLTIPEGRSRREVVPIVEKADLEGDYLRATASRDVLRRIRRLGAPRGTDTVEGFLFPATYELVKGGRVADLVDKQLDAFADNLESVDLAAARRRRLNRYDVLIIASMVEREAQLDKERPLIAAVIHNRLREGMPLGIDATIRYVENNWSRPLRVSELNRDTPYNTRLNRGLPPTPIGNPGLKSLQAAARPRDVDYLFYVVKPGTCGEHAFSSTDAEFQRDRARYDAERARAGGRSPTTC